MEQRVSHGVDAQQRLWFELAKRIAQQPLRSYSTSHARGTLSYFAQRIGSGVCPLWHHTAVCEQISRQRLGVPYHQRLRQGSACPDTRQEGAHLSIELFSLLRQTAGRS